MKERIFYVINLDNRRMVTLGLFLIALLSSFFFLGLSVGKRQGTLEAYKNTIQQPGITEKRVEMSNMPPAVPENGMLEQTDQSYMKEEIISAEPVVHESPVAPKTKTTEDLNTVVAPEPETVTAAPVKKTARKTTSTKRAPVEKYTIQVAAFTKESQADRLVKKIRNNKKITSVTYIKPEGNFYMVRVGKYRNKAAIERLQKTVNAELKVKSMIVKKKF